MASVTTLHPQARPAGEPAVRRITITDLREALRRGYEDFLAIPTQLVFLCVLYPVLGLVMARVAFGENLLALLYPMVAGFALLGPLAALGIYELSRRREQGLPVSWLNTFDVLRSPAILTIGVLAIMLVGIFVVWLAVAHTLWGAIMGAPAPDAMGGVLSLVFGTSRGFMLLLVGNLVGAAFATAVLVLTVVSFPVALDRHLGPVAAVRTSIRAVLANPVTMLIWGVIVGAALFLGSLPLFAGLAVALPVLGHATWHLYRRVVET